MIADITIQITHITTGLNAQLAAHDAPIGAGVVHGVRDTTCAIQPSLVAPYARQALINGTNTNGRNSIGFMMIGAPNRIGSLMLKKLGTTPILPIVRRCATRLRSSRNASGKVEPTPPISR